MTGVLESARSVGIEANAGAIGVRNGEKVGNAIDFRNFGPNVYLSEVSVFFGNYLEGRDTLSVVAEHDITSRFEASDGVLTLSGLATAEQYEGVLDSLVYQRSGGSGAGAANSLTYEITGDIRLGDVEGPTLRFYDGHLYAYVNDAATYSAAQDAAALQEALGAYGYLATITSINEQGIIEQVLAHADATDAAWLGGIDAENDGSWVWSTGPEADKQFWPDPSLVRLVSASIDAPSPTYAHWAVGQPDDGGQGSDIPENYLAIQPNGTWIDEASMAEHGYIVEFGDQDGDPIFSFSDTVQIDLIRELEPPRPSHPTPPPPPPPAPIVVRAPAMFNPDGSVSQSFTIDNLKNPFGGTVDLAHGLTGGPFQLGLTPGSSFEGQMTEKDREAAEAEAAADAAYAQSQGDIQQDIQDAIQEMLESIINFLKELREAEVDMMRAVTKLSSDHLVFDASRGNPDTLQSVKLDATGLSAQNLVEFKGIEKAFVVGEAKLIKDGPGFLFASGGDQHIVLKPGVGPSGVVTGDGDDTVSIVMPAQQIGRPPIETPPPLQYNGGTGINIVEIGGQYGDVVRDLVSVSSAVQAEAAERLAAFASNKLALSTGAGRLEIDNVQILSTDDGLHLLDKRAALQFDEAQYLKLNPDVAAAVESGQFTSGRLHFETYGMHEDRLVGLPFDEAFYLRQNPDVAAAVKAGLISSGRAHFDAFGISEGRDAVPLFDTVSYLEHNPDVAEAVQQGLTTAYEHFVRFGDREGREASDFFDPDAYYAQNPDVAAAGMDALTHLYQYGIDEGRVFKPAELDVA